MAGFWQLASMLREQVNATAWRSDVLKPLAWLIAMLVLLLTMLAFAKVPEWLLISISIALIGSIFFYAAAYTICFLLIVTRFDQKDIPSTRWQLSISCLVIVRLECSI